MVSLEEAFVSLGMNEDEDNFPGPDNQSNSNQLSHASIPRSFFEDKSPTFSDQVCAVLLEKWFKFKQNKAAVFFATFPLLFIIGGVIIGNMFEDKKVTHPLLLIFSR